MTEKKIRFYMSLAETYAASSTCPRASVGAVVVSAAEIPLGFGYNGAPRGVKHCDKPGIGCEVVNGSCQRTIHAEVNAICHALKGSDGPLLKDCSLFVTHFPCRACFNLTINMGIKTIYYLHPYKISQSALSIARDLGVEIIPMDPQNPSIIIDASRKECLFIHEK
jgi:dCMP deaminase